MRWMPPATLSPCPRLSVSLLPINRPPIADTVQKAKAPAKKAAGPKPKATAAKPKAAKQSTLTKVTKAAPKSKPKKRAHPASDDENSDGGLNSVNDDSLLSNTPPSAKKQKTASAPRPAGANKAPLIEVENESFAMDPPAAKPAAAKKKTGGATDQYQKLTQLEHILKRPDTYIGSVESTTEQMWVYNSETDAMENRKVSYVPGLYKIFDEILVNAADNKQRDKNMNELRVKVNKEQGVISVRNNGRGIPIEIHQTEGIYIPEMIFGHLLTSSNYDDDQAKVTGGRNGYGAKLTNIYSTQFILETVDSRQKKKYKQVWKHNMSKMEPAKIDASKGGDDFTQITFKPDFSKFGMDGMDEDFEALVKRRVYDMAGTCTGVKVYLNDQRIKITKFKQYMEMYTKAIKTENVESDGKEPRQVILTDNPHERWEIGFAVSDGSFQQVSFVNSIATTSGGSHVNFISEQVCERLEEIVNKINKGGVKLKKSQIRNHIFLFVNCLIVNPAFTSQTKEQLTTKPSQFGSKPQVSEKFLKEIAKTEAVNNILHFAQKKGDKVLAKSDGSRRQRMNNSKLTDANKAGTKDGHKCTLILTEGDSAALLALAGRAVVNPDLFGVFPLRGKILNVRDASIDQISKNQEIQNIKKFMGLQHKKDYADAKGLRYGHLMIMTDQDHDGSHIKGLLINFLQCQYPSLLKIEKFLMEFITPIVKVWKGDQKKPRSKRDFFTMPEYEAWREEPGHQKGWEHKYFKGLGTSDPKTDAIEYFSDLDKHLKAFHKIQEGEAEMIDLAFSKKKADARKQWLGNFVPGTYLDMSGTDEITYDDFINKELILFSMADNMRSIPSVIDGFKPGQRKVLYTCFRRNLKKDIKVVELAGSVSGLTAYAYGDTSLQQTIVGLAQNFVGSNNINCLEPSGSFGSRLQGGQDAASARYIYTRLSPFARRIFQPSDEALLTYNTDDGKTIEPEMYMPILPMILVNGADGIGTGWSTTIPNYRPEDIIENLKRRMDGNGKESMLPMKPWFRGWTGTSEAAGEDRWRFNGIVSESGENEVEITELPIRVWTQDFKDRLEDIIKGEKAPSFIKDYTEYNTPERVHFVVKMEEQKFRESINRLDELFKLSKTVATSNMVAFDPQGRIHKYATPLDIMEEFYRVRLDMYIRRKRHQLSVMQTDHERLSNQSRFVKMIIDGQLTVSRKKKNVLVAELQKLGFTRFPKVVDAKKEGEFEAVVNDEHEDEADDAETAAGASDFDYLLGMAIWSLTQERVDRLMRQIGDKEEEINVLSAKAEKDLWKDDLDALLLELQQYQDDEDHREKKARSKGRRASAKLGMAGGAGKARKRKAETNGDGSDSDFVASKKAAKPAAKPKSAMSGLLAAHAPPNAIEQKPVLKAPAEQSTLHDAFARVPPSDDAGPVSRGQKPAVPGPAAKKAAPLKKKAVVEELPDSDVEMTEAPRAVEAKSARNVTAGAAAKKPAGARKKLVLDDEREDSDLGMVEASKPAAKKPAAAKKKLVLDDELEDSDLEMVEASKPAAKKPPTTSRSAPAPKRGKKVVSDDDDDDIDVFAAVAKEASSRPAPAPTRRGRAAAQKPKKYLDTHDTDDDDDDDLLGDVSAMVKGIGGAGPGAAGPGAAKPSQGATRLYHPASASRPGSAQMTKAKPGAAGAGRRPVAAAGSDISEDETDWAALAQNSPQKAASRTMLSEEADEDDDVGGAAGASKDRAPAPKPKPAAAPRPAPPKSQPALKPKKPAARAEPSVPRPLSPAAKAYAAKQQQQAKAGAARGAGRVATSDPTPAADTGDDATERLADAILSDDDEADAPGSPVPVAASSRPRRAAAAAKPKPKPAAKRYVESEEDDDDEEEEEFDEGDDDDDDGSDEFASDGDSG